MVLTRSDDEQPHRLPPGFGAIPEDILRTPCGHLALLRLLSELSEKIDP